VEKNRLSIPHFVIMEPYSKCGGIVSPSNILFIPHTLLVCMSEYIKNRGFLLMGMGPKAGSNNCQQFSQV
jgi:hypothetical protein